MKYKSVHCTCNDWKDNIDKLNAGFLMNQLHGMSGYDGKIMVYCCWCGKKLKEK